MVTSNTFETHDRHDVPSGPSGWQIQNTPPCWSTAPAGFHRFHGQTGRFCAFSQTFTAFVPSKFKVAPPDAKHAKRSLRATLSEAVVDETGPENSGVGHSDGLKDLQDPEDNPMVLYMFFFFSMASFETNLWSPGEVPSIAQAHHVPLEVSKRSSRCWSHKDPLVVQAMWRKWTSTVLVRGFWQTTA